MKYCNIIVITNYAISCIKHTKLTFILNKQNGWEWTLSGSGQGKMVFLKKGMNHELQKMLEISLVTFIVAPCVMESIYCSLTNKCTFY